MTEDRRVALRYSTPHLIVYPREPNSTIRKSSQAAAGEYGSMLRHALMSEDREPRAFLEKRANIGMAHPTSLLS